MQNTHKLYKNMQIFLVIIRIIIDKQAINATK